jgi:hypothetical protein
MKYLYHYCFFICIVLFFAYINSYTNISNKKESFTTSVRGFYRPIIRNSRLAAEGFYSKTRKNLDDLFLKFGLS